MEKQKIGTFLMYFCKAVLLVLAIGWIVFALMSGAESSGFFKNIPNALPWLVLLVFVGLSFRWEIIGGVLVVLFGIFTVLFFGTLKVISVFLLISFPLILLGLILSLTGFLIKKLR